MQILHINSYYSKSKFYENLFNNQIKSGHEIDVFIPVPYNFDYSNDDYGVYSRVSANYSNVDRFFYSRKQNKILKDIHNKYIVNQFDVIHAHSLFTNGYIAMKLKQKYNIPYIVAVRNTDINTFFKLMIHLRKIGVSILKNADKVIFLSDPYKKELFKKYIPNKFKDDIQQKSEVIPNGIDDYWFNNIGVSKMFDSKNVKVLYVGEINKNKNILTTISALQKLAKENYCIKFTVIGKINDNQIFEKMKNVRFVSYHPPMDKQGLIEYYRENDIFVMPSKHESFGLVYAESMSQGTPVIYSKGQGFDKQFKDGEVGFSVNYNNDEEIYRKIKEVINNYEELSNNCIINSHKFKWTKISEAYEQLYQELVEMKL